MATSNTIELPPAVISSRIAHLTNTAGSVAAVAAWCAVHAFQAEAVVQALMAALTAPSSSRDVRLACIYVVHELVITCWSRGSSDDSAKATMHQIFSQFPAALKSAIETETLGGAAAVEFAEPVLSVLNRWHVTKAFPAPWVTDLITATRRVLKDGDVAAGGGVAASGAVGGSGLASEAGIPAELLALSRLYARYKAAKEAVSAAEQRGAAASEVESAKEEAVRRLIVLMKAVGCGEPQTADGSTPSLSQQLIDDMATLTGAAQQDTTDALAGFF